MQSNNQTYIERLGHLELERAALLQQLTELQRRLRSIDREYTALKSFVATGETMRKGSASSTVEAAHQLLKNAGVPLHYKDLYRRLAEDFFFIGGSAPFANLVVQLNRDRRFMRFGRGMYGLKAWSIALAPSQYPIMAVSAPEEEAERSLTIARERERSLGRLETLQVEIKITQINLRALREQLKTESLEQLPEGLNPAVALRALRQRLKKLLEQREDVRERLKAMKAVATEEGT